MRLFAVLLFLPAFILGFTVNSMAENIDQRCMNMVNKAVDVFMKDPKKAQNFINSPNLWVYREVYVFALTMDNKMFASPNKKEFIGKSMNDYYDEKTGKHFFRNFLEKAQSERGEGWVSHYWWRPGEKEKSYKRSFVKKVPGKPYYVVAGYYPLEKSK